MSSHSDRFPSPAGPSPDDDSGATPSADQSPDAGERVLSEAEQRQLRLDAIKRAIDEGVYDHDDLFDRALRRMIDHDDLADDSGESAGEM
ncbi:MAG: hypothetical protein NXI04_06025 [Planctomycetaceae bacterium]|nr:hypothetical protein [Planctomycetaceae bacterium]